MKQARIRDATVGRLPRWLRRAGRIVLLDQDRQNALHEWRRASRGAPELDLPVRRVMVVCHGNICRSPFAAALLARRLTDLEVRSAGLEARDGKPAQPAAARIARMYGIELESHGAHRLRAEDVLWADLILGMEGHHGAVIRRRWPEGTAKTFLLGDFFSEGPYLIHDPYGHDDETFAAVFERIAAGVGALEEAIRGRG